MEEQLIERQKLVLEIMALAYAVHENTDYCTFIEFSGHVDSLSISIRESKKNWQNNVCDSQRYLKMREYKDGNVADADLLAVRDILREILKTGEVDYSSLEKQVEEVYKYSF